MRPKAAVSAIIVNWNGARPLEICLPSLLAQSYRPLDLLDNGISLYDQDRQMVLVWSLGWMKLGPGIHEINCTVPTLPLRSGPYTWFAWMWDDEGFVDRWDGCPEMVVVTEDLQHPQPLKRGLLNVPCLLEVRKTY